MSRIRPGKTISLLLSLAIVIGSMPITAFAETPTEGTVTVPSLSGGGEETVNVTVTVTPNGDGTTTTEKKTPEGGDTTGSGLNVNYEGTTVTDGNNSRVSDESHYTVSNSSGTYGAEGGSETKTGVTGDGSVGDITIGIIQDGKKAGTEGSVGSSTSGSTTIPTHEGDNLKSEDPANFDQTTITTETARTATAEITAPTVKVGDPTYVDDDGKKKEPERNDGYHYFYYNGTDGIGDDVDNGQGQYKVTCTIKKDGDADRTYKIDTVYNMFVKYNNADDPNDPQNGKLTGGLYCVDFSTDATLGQGYTKVNLEDAADEEHGYYTEAEAAKLRAIINNGFIFDGYCGENSNNYDETGAPAARYEANKDSVGALKAQLLNSLGSDGKLHNSNVTADIINNLSWEEAAVATQMAIWSVANRIPLEDGETAVFSTGNANINALCAYLLTLSEDATNADGSSKESQILSEDRFIDNMDIIIGSMVDGNTANSDDDHNNDVYNVDLKFSLKVTPGANDDLIVKVLNSEGQVVKTARIAGDGSADEFGCAKRETGSDGSTYYVLEDLQLAENSKNTFNLKLEGVQYLEEGVYVFQSRIDENHASTSQNLIGKYSGTADIDLSMQFDLTFDVDEGTVTTTREWRSEWTNSGGHHDDEEDGDDEEETQEDEDGGEELDIPDDEVPLSSVPRTGDDSGLWLSLTALCACGLAALALTGRKREQA